MKESKSISTLDSIKNQKGINNLKEFFIQSLTEDEDRAISLINDEESSYSSLFILKDTIKDRNIEHKISKRKRIALILTKEILNGERNFSIINESSFSHVHSLHSTLKWIVESGYLDDGFDNDYDEVLDKASIVLLNVYYDKTIIPTILEMIFKRHINELFIHDLVWAYFQSYDKDSLKLIANRLLSNNESEVDLANKLLNFIPKVDETNTSNNEKQYLYAINWLNENNPYLYSTGESYQQKSNPVFYRLNIDAKYICKYIDVTTGKFIEPLSTDENELLKEFSTLEYPIKSLLSNYSSKLHNESLSLWKAWLSYPLNRKIKTAYRMGGGVL